MTQKELLAESRQFIERTYTSIDGRVPSKKALETAAREIASALALVRSDVKEKSQKRRVA